MRGMPVEDSERPASERREALKHVLAQARSCVRCPELAATRRTVVFGSGNADADLMFVGEAPGASEDEQGIPFVGRAGKLLDKLLEEIGLSRAEVFVCNTLKCRPPGNRDPLPVELDNCQEYLHRQVALIRPSVICTLGNFSTKLLRRDPTGITRLHGQVEVISLGARTVRLYPIYHPAAALYTPRMLETLREDFARLPGLLALGAPDQPPAIEEPAPPIDDVGEAEPAAVRDPEPAAARDPELPAQRFARGAASPSQPDAGRAQAPSEADQLGLF
jgi:uracil-DNA glycosylase